MIKRLLKHTFSLLNADHVNLGPKWNYQNVISPYYRIYYIDAGEGKISDQAQTLLLEPGYLYIIPSFTLCNLYCPAFLSQYFIQFFEESSDGISLFSGNRAISKVRATDFDIKAFARLLDINPGRGINRSDNPSVYEKSVFYKEYQELNNQQTLSAFMETQGIILQFLARFLTPVTFVNRDANRIPVKVLDAISYIAVNLHLPLTVGDLAARANQNPDHFSRIFQQATGERPMNYIHEKRIERAQYLIVTSKMTLHQIAEHTGFDNVFYFSKIFKKVTGLSPGNYKKQIETF